MCSVLCLHSHSSTVNIGACAAGRTLWKLQWSISIQICLGQEKMHFWHISLGGQTNHFSYVYFPKVIKWSTHTSLCKVSLKFPTLSQYVNLLKCQMYMSSIICLLSEVATGILLLAVGWKSADWIRRSKTLSLLSPEAKSNNSGEIPRLLDSLLLMKRAALVEYNVNFNVNTEQSQKTWYYKNSILKLEWAFRH